MLWLLQDLRFALRSVVKDRSFFSTSILTLALGIGGATIIFSVIHAILLDPFPYRDSQRIYDIRVQDNDGKANSLRNWFSVPEFLDLERHNGVFDRTLGVWEETTLFGDPSAPESLDTDRVTGGAFQMLGVPALLGRGLLPSDATLNAPPVFVLSYKVWVKRFGLDPSIVGKTFRLNNTPTTLVGIMPPRFTFWGGDIWMPAVLDRAHPGNLRFVLYGHLRPGITPRAAQQQLAALIHRLSAAYPDRYAKKFSVTIESLGDQTIGRFKPTLYLLLGAVSMILLIACANVTNLLLARATTRRHEFALRRALGASRFRLIAQLLVESLLLALGGAAAGCLFAAAGVRTLMAMLPPFTFPDEAVVGLNYPVLLATVVTAAGTALIFGLTPALSVARADVGPSATSGGQRTTSFRQGRLRSGFIISQVALSLTLLVCAGLLMRTFFLQRALDLGFQPDHLLFSRLELPASGYPTVKKQSQFLDELLARLQRMPGVLSVAAASELPPHGAIFTSFDVAGAADASTWRGAYASPCTRGYFATVGQRLLAGRLPTIADEHDARHVAVVNQTMADRYFSGGSPLGRRLQLLATKPGRPSDAWFEIVGVVSDVKNNGVREAALPAAYIPHTTVDFHAFNLYLRTAGNPETIAPELARRVLALNRSVVPQQTLPMERILDVYEYAHPRFGLILLSAFASVGLVLAIVGVYGVASYSVAQRQRELGIRVALGANAREIRALILRASLKVLLAGVAVGVILSLLATRLLVSQIWGISRYDPLTFCVVIGLLIVVGQLASYLPSRRAARVDPAICLRSE